MLRKSTSRRHASHKSVISSDFFRRPQQVDGPTPRHTGSCSGTPRSCRWPVRARTGPASQVFRICSTAGGRPSRRRRRIRPLMPRLLYRSGSNSRAALRRYGLPRFCIVLLPDGLVHVEIMGRLEDGVRVAPPACKDEPIPKAPLRVPCPVSRSTNTEVSGMLPGVVLYEG